MILTFQSVQEVQVNPTSRETQTFHQDPADLVTQVIQWVQSGLLVQLHQSVQEVQEVRVNLTFPETLTFHEDPADLEVQVNLTFHEDPEDLVNQNAL